MTRNKRRRFPIASYMRRTQWLWDELDEWRDVYKERAEAEGDTWLGTQLLRRGLIADAAAHHLARAERELSILVQIPLAARQREI